MPIQEKFSVIEEIIAEEDRRFLAALTECRYCGRLPMDHGGPEDNMKCLFEHSWYEPVQDGNELEEALKRRT